MRVEARKRLRQQPCVDLWGWINKLDWRCAAATNCQKTVRATEVSFFVTVTLPEQMTTMLIRSKGLVAGSKERLKWRGLRSEGVEDCEGGKLT